MTFECHLKIFSRGGLDLGPSSLPHPYLSRIAIVSSVLLIFDEGSLAGCAAASSCSCFGSQHK